MPEPTKIPRAFAASGDKNSIPDSSGSPGFASWQEGFPAITSEPFAQGGIAPKRADFNGIFNALSAATVWNQQGGVYAYDNLTDYEIGNVVDDSGDLYVCTTANGPGSSVVVPSNDALGVAWRKLLSGVNGILSVTNGGTGEQSLPVALMDALPYSATVDYVAGALTTSSGDLYVCIGANGPSTVVAPVTDTTKWAKVILTTATQSDAGYMSALDKKKLDVIDIFVESGSTAASGLVPKPPTTPGTSKYLCEDATWKVPPFVPKGNSTVTITYDSQNVDDSYSTAFKANGCYYIMFSIHLKSGLSTWVDYWIAHLDVTGGAPLRTCFALTSQSNGLSVPCVCETDGNITLMQKGVNFADDWLWGGAVVPINM